MPWQRAEGGGRTKALPHSYCEAEQKPQILEEKPQTAHYWGPYSCTPEDSPLPVYPANTIESCLKTIVPSLKLLLGCAGHCPRDHCELPTGSCDPSFSERLTKSQRPKSFLSSTTRKVTAKLLSAIVQKLPHVRHNAKHSACVCHLIFPIVQMKRLMPVRSTGWSLRLL